MWESSARLAKRVCCRYRAGDESIYGEWLCVRGRCVVTRTGDEQRARRHLLGRYTRALCEPRLARDRDGAAERHEQRGDAALGEQQQCVDTVLLLLEHNLSARFGGDSRTALALARRHARSPIAEDD